MVGPANIDIETKTLRDMLSRGQWMPSEISGIEDQIKHRKAQIEAGLASPTSIWWTLKLQKELDRNLRMRWEVECCGQRVGHKLDCGGEIGWVLDRWVEQFGCWMPIGVLGRGYIREDLIAYLKSVDMQEIGAEQHLANKRAAAEKRREENERAGDEKVLAAVDILPESHRKNFIEVEDAIKHGEQITARGAMKDSLERIEKAGKRARTGANPGDETCVNPGHRPDRRQ